GRSVFTPELDGGELGADYFLMRELYFLAKLFGRYAMDMMQTAALASRKPGWKSVAIKLFLKYWLDVGQRRQSKRDRRALRGNALVGWLRKALQQRTAPLYLNTPLQ